MRLSTSEIYKGLRIAQEVLPKVQFVELVRLVR